jgi:hypothetical protein
MMKYLICGPLLALALVGQSAGAQYLTRTTRSWQTIETASFRIHYPEEMRAWVLPVAQRIESYAAAVNQIVGSKPAARTTVMVEDPSNVANGFALPLLEGPVIFLWPTPPTPTPTLGSHRGWGEVLAIHEYTHIAHLTVASRNASERFLWTLSPTKLGPLSRKSPPWLFEGYATYVEGRLTGSGRPYSVGRPAVLRQWALEGRLPKYQELNATQPFLSGSMRYLAGSSFLEWLAARKGDTSLRSLWRRMSATERRSFAEAFRGVYGAGPDDLYGTFFTEVTEKALAVRRELQQAGLVEGELVQRLEWGTGAPAVSKDGAMLAVVRRAPNKPSRLEVWRTADEPLDSRVAEARRRLLERDSLDVAPFDSFPPAKRPEATLHPSAGRGHESPRWFADNERLLISRDEPLGDGASRPDLFIWNRRSGSKRRVTRGVGIRGADPAPDGLSAAGVRCAGGICDLVRIDLVRGQVTTLAGGSPFVVWHRARFAPDGRHIAAAVQREGRWNVVVVDATTGGIRPIQPNDDAERYAPAWTPDGKLVVVSERGGIANLELLDPNTRTATTLTRVTGAVAEPDVGADGRIWFLSLHAKGYDVRRIALRTALGSGAERVVTLDARLAPAAPQRPTTGLTFREGAITGPSPYGLGPRGWRVLPGLNWGPDGDMLSLMFANLDPVGRFSTVLQGGTGQRGAWRGGSLFMAMRTNPIQIDGGAWYTKHEPSEQVSGVFASPDLDAKFHGATLAAGWRHEGGTVGLGARVGGSLGRVDGNQLDAAPRVSSHGEARLRLRIPLRSATIEPQVIAHASKGETGGDTWTRIRYTASLVLGQRLSVEASRGTVDAPDAGEFGREFEQFTVGGGATPFIDPSVLSQRIALPAVPVGFGFGSRFEMLRATMRIGMFRPYAMWIAAADSITDHQRIVGVEEEFDIGAIGFARLPSTRVRLGVGYSLDQPFRRKVRPYVSVVYRP